MNLILTREAHAAILAHAARATPLEACGLLLGTGERIEEARATVNVASDPARQFEIDPVALLAAYKAAREGGAQVLGWYHSHPNGLPGPSATDRARALGDGRVWAIAVHGAITCWRDTVDGFQPLSYLVAAG